MSKVIEKLKDGSQKAPVTVLILFSVIFLSLTGMLEKLSLSSDETNLKEMKELLLYPMVLTENLAMNLLFMVAFFYLGYKVERHLGSVKFTLQLILLSLFTALFGIYRFEGIHFSGLAIWVYGIAGMLLISQLRNGFIYVYSELSLYRLFLLMMFFQWFYLPSPTQSLALSSFLFGCLFGFFTSSMNLTPTRTTKTGTLVQLAAALVILLMVPHWFSLVGDARVLYRVDTLAAEMEKASIKRETVRAEEEKQKALMKEEEKRIEEAKRLQDKKQKEAREKKEKQAEEQKKKDAAQKKIDEKKEKEEKEQRQIAAAAEKKREEAIGQTPYKDRSIESYWHEDGEMSLYLKSMNFPDQSSPHYVGVSFTIQVFGLSDWSVDIRNEQFALYYEELGTGLASVIGNPYDYMTVYPGELLDYELYFEIPTSVREVTLIFFDDEYLEKSTVKVRIY